VPVHQWNQIFHTVEFISTVWNTFSTLWNLVYTVWNMSRVISTVWNVHNSILCN